MVALTDSDQMNETTSNLSILLSSSSSPDHIRSVYPPVQDMQPRVFVVMIIFALCFIVGICGNASVLTIIRGVVHERGRRRHNRPDRRQSGENTILYLAALCIVDFIMSMSLPPAIMDMIIGYWMFGTSICKLHHLCGSVGRIASTFLITAMSFDRYVGVCHVRRFRLRSRRTVIGIITALSGCALLLLLPMLIYAKPNETVLYTVPSKSNSGVANVVTVVRIFKCTDMMPTGVFYWFTTSTFLFGYCVPLVLIVVFNASMIRRLYTHTRQLPTSSIPLRRVVGYTILIAVFYFVCWTPYWMSVLYAIYMNIFSDEQTAPDDSLLFVIYCVHLLPYLNSACNWVLYGLLNTQLQRRRELMPQPSTFNVNAGGGGGGCTSTQCADEYMSCGGAGHQFGQQPLLLRMPLTDYDDYKTTKNYNRATTNGRSHSLSQSNLLRNGTDNEHLPIHHILMKHLRSSSSISRLADIATSVDQEKDDQL